MIQGDAVMKARFARDAARLFGSRRASTLGLLLTLIASGSAAASKAPPNSAGPVRPTSTVSAGEIPNARAITACLRRQKSSLSPACAAVFGQ